MPRHPVAQTRFIRDGRSHTDTTFSSWHCMMGAALLE